MGSGWTSTLTVANALTIDSTLTMAAGSGGKIDNHGVSITTGNVQWTSGNITGSSVGDLYIGGFGGGSNINGTGTVVCGDLIHLNNANTSLTISNGVTVQFQNFSNSAAINPNNTYAVLYTRNCTLSDGSGVSAYVN